MKRKIIVCIIVTLVFTTVIPILGIAEESKNKTIDIAMNRDYSVSSSGTGNSEGVSKLNNEVSIITVSNNDGDFLDQYQNSTGLSGWNLYGNQWIAQSFTPSVNRLTRVQLCMFKGGNPPEDAEIVLSIRESFQGDDLTSITLKSDKLPSNSSEGVWIEFNFQDINVTPNYLYYMVCKGTAGDRNNCYDWLFNDTNPYKNGEAWATLDYGQTWIKDQNHSNADCCFKTYGYKNNPPNTPTITGVTNGTIRTSYVYTIQTTDPNQDDVEYLIDWGDNNNSGWIGPYKSGDFASASYSWSPEGTYAIKVKARDAIGAESDWATLIVSMPCNTIVNTSFMQFLQNHPSLFPMLQKIIQRLGLQE